MSSQPTTNGTNGSKKHYKRLIVCCDGTWQKADAPHKPKKRYATGTGSIPESNVVRLGRSLRKAAVVTKDGETYHVPQVLFYQNGVGTDYLLDLGPVFAGAVGGGLNANVCEAYWFIANNWEEGDEIFLFGFSRGAYTARAVAGLIGNIGILGRRELHKFQDIYEMYMHRNEDPTEWKKFLDGIPRKATGVPIKVVGVFDTVGSVGIPDNFVVNAFGGNKKYHFHDTELSSHIENALHALALNEQRQHFAPTMWYLRKEVIKQLESEGKKVPKLKQCWFPGYHIDVGGGTDSDSPVDRKEYDGFSDISFAWMVDQCTPFLDFHDCVKTELVANNRRSGTYRDNLGTYGTRKLHSNLGDYKIAPKTVRTPGQYSFLDPTGRSGDQPMDVVTNETIHPSARMRKLKADILKQDHQPEWNPSSLHGFEFTHCNGDEPAGWKWVKKTKSRKGVETVVATIYEEDVLCDGKSYSGQMMNEADSRSLRMVKSRL